MTLSVLNTVKSKLFKNYHMYTWLKYCMYDILHLTNNSIGGLVMIISTIIVVIGAGVTSYSVKNGIQTLRKNR